jgi:aryl-alcohol dehydrogenase-like predicted oxidoreductase
MGERYTSGEAMEHVEKTHEFLEKSEHAVLRHVPLVAAGLAVFAGLSSLMGARTGEAMLVTRTEAVLAQARATDQWNEYQADSLKAHLGESLAVIATTVQTRGKLSTAAKEYRGRQGPLKKSALDSERQRDDELSRSTAFEERKQYFDVAVAMFEVAIVLTSVAAMVRKPALFVFAALLALGAVAADLAGFFH